MRTGLYNDYGNFFGYVIFYEKQVNAQGQEWAKLRSKLTPKTLESKRVLSVFCPGKFCY